MKGIFIIYKGAGNSETDWSSWLKKELEKKDLEVFIPKMPFDEPTVEDSVACLKKAVGNLDNETYFVEHSIGCQAIMRLLDKSDSLIGGAVFVARWFKLDNLKDEEIKEIAKPWTKEDINFAKLKSNISKLTVFLSTSEPYGMIKENEQIFKQRLKAKVIIKKEKGHFTEDDGLKEAPFVLEEVLKLTC